MNSLIIYIIQSTISISLLYMVYWLFLRRDTFFSVNRFYLIGSIIFSLLIPIFKIPVLYQNATATYVVVLETITITANTIESSFLSNLDIFETILIVYLTGAGIFAIRFMFQMLQLGLLIRKSGIQNVDGLKVVYLKRNYSPFSFFNIVFLNKDIIKDKNINKIIEHEKIHIDQKHSLDLIVLEILTILQWFNPFIWFYKNSIKGIHEFLADEGIINGGINRISYQNLLLQQTVGIQLNDLTNNFNQSLIKRRFIMMSKQQSTRWAKFKVLLVMPIASILVIMFSFSFTNVIAQEVKGTEKPKQIEVKEVKNTDETSVFTVVEQMPKYPGGSDAMIKFISNNIKYPEEARAKGISGRVYVTYIVEADGRITDVKILRGIHEQCDAEAKRVVEAMPKWTPGKQRGKAVRVQFNVPIKFTLDNGEIKKEDALPPPKK